MNYKNYGNSYDNYLPNSNLGYSNVSKGYNNKISARSNHPPIVDLNDEHGGLS